MSDLGKVVRSAALVAAGFVAILLTARATRRSDAALPGQSQSAPLATPGHALPPFRGFPAIPNQPTGDGSAKSAAEHLRVGPALAGQPEVNLGIAYANPGKMLESSWAAMESPDAELESYLLSWRTVTKAAAATRKLWAGDFEYVTGTP